jgi:hypothetical protein
MATLAALVIGYALWALSGLIVEWSGTDALLPVVRLGVVFVGLSLAETIYHRAEELCARRQRMIKEGTS